jgi:molybdenum cofactor synthesis domain-containing protein
VIIRKGSTIRPHHIMALASIGCRELSVWRKPQVGLFSTGAELLTEKKGNPDAQRIEDVNGPYIYAVLESLGYETRFLGVIDDNSPAATQEIGHHLQQRRYDLLISTGGVSAGKFDSIRESVEKLGAQVLFHKVAMRPGHPALFASIPSSNKCHYPNRERSSKVAFFGLPGNPVASAACLRFLVLPFLRILLSQPIDQPVKAIIRRLKTPGNAWQNNPCNNSSSPIAHFPAEMEVFRPGQLRSQTDRTLEVGLIADHSPGKIRPFVSGDCWIQIHRGNFELTDGNIVDVFPML